MKLFFTIFSITFLTIIEIMFGNFGIFFPILSLGIIYFAQTNSRLFMLIAALITGIIIDIYLYHRAIPINLFIFVLLIFLQKPYKHLIDKGLAINSLIGGIIFTIIYLINCGISFYNNWDLISNLFLFFSTIIFNFFLGTVAMMILLITLESIAEKLKLPLFLQSGHRAIHRSFFYSRSK